MKDSSGKISLERAQRIASKIIELLAPDCKRIEIAGSIRRRRPWVNDIDIVLIPRDHWELHNKLLRLGQMKMSGSKIARVMYGDIQIDFYFANEESWATLLLVRTGSAAHNVKLASLAKSRGWHLHANGDGLFDDNGKRIAGDSEESIFKALGLRYLPPEKREV
jgi:DNA polymerase (family 10)